MADLASLMNMSPGVGGFFAGQNHASSLATEEARRRELEALMQNRMMEEQRKQELHPSELQKALLANQTAEAQLPGLQATSRKLGVDADVAEGTKASTIQQKNLTNDIEGQRMVLNELGTISQGMSTVSDVEKPRYFAEEIRRRGFPDPEGLIKKFAHIPVSQLPAAIDAMVKRQLENNPEFVRDKYKTDEDNKNKITTTGMNNASAMALENRRIEAGKYNRKETQQNVDQRLLRAKSAAEKAEILEQAYYEVRVKDPDLADSYASRAYEARKRAAEDAKNRGVARPGIDMPAVSGLPEQAGPAADAPIAGKGGPAPAGQPQAGRVSVINPDGKRGSIPANQLNDALKKGYKKAQ